MTAEYLHDPTRSDTSSHSCRRVSFTLVLGLGLALGPLASTAAFAAAGIDAGVRSSIEDQAARLTSPEAIYERVYRAYEKLDTVRLRIRIEQRIAETGTPSTITGMLYASKAAGVVRFEIVAPDVLEDQVIVVSSEDQMVRTYVPVTERVIERPLDQLAHDQMNPDQWQSIDELLQLPSIEDFRFELVQLPHASGAGSRYKEGMDPTDDRYVLDVTSKEHPELGVQRFWVDPSMWLPTEVSARDTDGVQMYHIYLDQIERNVDISEGDLVKMP